MKQLRKTRTRASRFRSKLDIRLGIDIGGTFTDLVAQADSGESWRVKVPTTPSQPAQGALDSVRRFLKDSEVNPKRVKVVVHATTLASNALLTGTLPKVALVTTEGFRDVLEIGRQNRPELYNLQVERPRPLIPRRYRFEVRERVTYQGRVLQPLHVEQTRRVARKIRRLGTEAVAICFLHSYANPRHEKIASDIIRRESPQTKLTLSSELLPEFREYERTSTTVVNACLQPVISDYVAEIEKGLALLRIRAPLFVMQSNGGTLLSPQACEEPARIIESGPVAGAVASRFYGRRAGGGGIISLDVGGTTSKAGVWSSERFEVTNEYEVGGAMHGVRRLEGSGYPVRFPYVDLVEVGTGGGSISHVDPAGVLHVGPESAGAIPGPACYGRGGDRPTLTDASLLLGRLNAEFLLGGEVKVSRALAEKAIREHLARPMRNSSIEAAVGVLRVALSNIAGVLRSASVERGLDPREMTLVAFGGAGPMHACEVAEKLGTRRVLVPPWAGLFSSLGLLLAEPLHDYVRTMLEHAEETDFNAMTRTFVQMEDRGRAILRIEGLDDARMTFERLLDMRYEGQSFELSIPVPTRRVDRRLVRNAARAFHVAHKKRYGYSDAKIPVEVVNLRVYCKGRGAPRIPRLTVSTTGPARPKAFRRVFLGDGFVDDCPVYDRSSLGRGFRGKGPCVVEDYDSTIVVPRNVRSETNSDGSLVLSLPGK